MSSFKIVFFVFIFCSVEILCSQPLEKIKFAKNSNLIYFFQKGAKSDTIIKNKSDLFYLLVPDSMKAAFSLSVENGRLTKTGNDSIFTLEHMPGLKYETFYMKPDPASIPLKGREQKNAVTPLELKTLINGATDKEKNLILIRIINKKEEKVILENSFYYP